jgi:hypothetical protein
MAEGFQHGYALLIGVGGNLPESVNDAADLSKLLINPQRAGYPKGQVELLTSGNATRQGILDAFDRLKESTKNDPEATVIVYYSGHGGVFELGGKAVDYFMVPYDYDPKDRQHTAISGHEFTDKVKAIKSRKLVVFLDCCHASGIPKAKDDLHTYIADNQPEDLLKELKKGSGKILVASCGKGELSVTDGTHSVFTRVLIEAMEGNPLTAWDGFTHLWAVLNFISRHVPNLATKFHNEQTVKIVDAADIDNFPLCRAIYSPSPILIPELKDRDLYIDLMNLGFEMEEAVYKKQKEISSLSSFVIHGSFDYGHYWLLRRFLDRLRQEGGLDYPFDMGRNDLKADIDEVWDELARHLELEDEAPRPEIYQNLAEAIHNHPVALLFKNVQYMFPSQIPNLIDDFWYPLAKGIQEQLNDQPKYKLFMFMIFYNDEKPWPVDLPENLEQTAQPCCPIKLNLSTIGQDDLKGWLKYGSHGRLSDYDEIDTNLVTVWQQSNGGVPEKVARKIFQICGANYRGHDQWLNV